MARMFVRKLELNLSRRPWMKMTLNRYHSETDREIKAITSDLNGVKDFMADRSRPPAQYDVFFISLHVTLIDTLMAKNI